MKAKEGAMKQESKKEEKKESEKKEGAEAPAKQPGGGEKADGSDGKHDDEAQDKKLISDMLAKHMDKDDDHEAAYAHAKEVYENYKEMGHEPKEAVAKTEAYVEYAKHIAKKEAAAKKDAPADKGNDGDADDKKESAVEGEAKKEAHHAESKSQEEEVSKEAAMEGHKKMESEVAKLKAENAKLLERALFAEGSDASKAKLLMVQELEAHVEDVLGKSGVERKFTKSFRESNKGIKSKEEFNKVWKVFLEGYNSGKTSGSDVELAIPLLTEKQVSRSSEGSILDGCLK